MGQKTHPIGFRLGVSAEWRSNWFAGKPEGYRSLVQEDYKIRQIVADEYQGEGAISRVDIDRGGGEMSINVYTSRPGIIIGRNGQRIDRLRHVIERATRRRVRISANEIKVPGTRRQIGRCQPRRAARKPYSVPPSGAHGDATHHGFRCRRNQSRRRRTSWRRGDRSRRQADGGSGTAPHATSEDRLRHFGSAHDLWRHRHQSMDFHRRHARRR